MADSFEEVYFLRIFIGSKLLVCMFYRVILSDRVSEIYLALHLYFALCNILSFCKRQWVLCNFKTHKQNLLKLNGSNSWIISAMLKCMPFPFFLSWLFYEFPIAENHHLLFLWVFLIIKYEFLIFWYKKILEMQIFIFFL